MTKNVGAPARKNAPERKPERPQSKQEAGWHEPVLSLQCPQCGAQIDAAAQDVTHRCAHCRSLLLVQSAQRETWLQRPVILSAQQIHALFVDQAVEGYAALTGNSDTRPEWGGRSKKSSPQELTLMMAGMMLGPVGAIATGAAVAVAHLVDRRIRASELSSTLDDKNWSVSSLHVDGLRSGKGVQDFRTQVANRTKILDVSRFFAPFVHLEGTTARVVVDVSEDGVVDLALKIVPWAETTGMFDPSLNLRVTGLRSAKAALLRIDKAVPWDFLWLPERRLPPDRKNDSIRTTRVPAKIGPALRDTSSTQQWLAVVYRPYILASVRSANRTFSLLVDAASSTIAGYPTGSERAAIRRQMSSKSPHVVQRPVRAMPSRCPGCGNEVAPGPLDVVVVCRRCRAAATPTANGLRTIPLDVATCGLKGSVCFVPFWRFAFTIRRGDAEFRDLRAWTLATRRERPSRAQPPDADRLAIPAVRWSDREGSDAAFSSVVRSINRRPPEYLAPSDDFAIECSTHRLVPVRVDASSAEHLARAVLASLIEEETLLRDKVRAVDDFAVRPALFLSDPRISFVAFARTANSIKLGKLVLPDAFTKHWFA